MLAKRLQSIIPRYVGRYSLQLPSRRKLHLAPPFLLDSYTPRHQLLSSVEAAKKRSAAYAHLRNCNLCPRLCGVNRYEKTGTCLIGAEIVKVSTIAPHFGEGEACDMSIYRVLSTLSRFLCLYLFLNHSQCSLWSFYTLDIWIDFALRTLHSRPPWLGLCILLWMQLALRLLPVSFLHFHLTRQSNSGALLSVPMSRVS